MKKIMVLLLCVLLLISAVGCGKKKNKDEKKNDPVADNSVIQQDDDGKNDVDNTGDNSDNKETDVTDNIENTQKDPDYQKIDVDLSVLSATAAYAQLYNMMENPEDYKDKVVKIKGSYMLRRDEENNIIYHYCVVSDATACCAESIEFELIDRFVYPDDYPEEYAQIILIGVFSMIYEDEYYFYCVLKNALML